MTREMEMRYIPWTWIAACLVSIVMMAGAYFLADTRKVIADQQCLIYDLKEKKMDRAEVREVINRIESKVDELYRVSVARGK